MKLSKKHKISTIRSNQTMVWLMGLIPVLASSCFGNGPDVKHNSTGVIITPETFNFCDLVKVTISETAASPNGLTLALRAVDQTDTLRHFAPADLLQILGPEPGYRQNWLGVASTGVLGQTGYRSAQFNLNSGQSNVNFGLDIATGPTGSSVYNNTLTWFTDGNKKTSMLVNGNFLYTGPKSLFVSTADSSQASCIVVEVPSATGAFFFDPDFTGPGLPSSPCDLVELQIRLVIPSGITGISGQPLNGTPVLGAGINGYYMQLYVNDITNPAQIFTLPDLIAILGGVGTWYSYIVGEPFPLDLLENASSKSAGGPNTINWFTTTQNHLTGIVQADFVYVGPSVVPLPTADFAPGCVDISAPAVHISLPADEPPSITGLGLITLFVDSTKCSTGVHFSSNTLECASSSGCSCEFGFNAVSATGVHLHLSTGTTGADFIWGRVNSLAPVYPYAVGVYVTGVLTNDPIKVHWTNNCNGTGPNNFYPQSFTCGYVSPNESWTCTVFSANFSGSGGQGCH